MLWWLNQSKDSIKNNSTILIDINNNDFDFKEVIKSHTEKIEKEVIQDSLNKFKGNKSKTARFLKIDYKTLLKKISDYVI